MSQLSMARRRDRRITRRFGGGAAAVLRQKNSLIEGLFVFGGAFSGASSLVATSGDGEVVRGAVFSLAGISGAYTVAEGAKAASGRLTLAFDPPLAGNAADAAAVTFSQPYGEYRYPVMDGTGTAEVDKEITAGRRVRVLAYVQGNPDPRDHDDELDGLPVTGVHAVGNPPTRFRLTVTSP
jgi:hypothetical protein